MALPEKTEEKQTIFIIEDNKDIADGTAFTLNTVKYNTVIYENALDFLEYIKSDKNKLPACIILDVRLPGLTGLELQKKLKEKKIQISIIFTSAYGDIQMAVEVMKKGAVDFLVKPVRDHDLLEAVYKALESNSDQKNRKDKQQHDLALLNNLTPTEKKVLGLLLQGKQNKQIADEVHRSNKTIEVHRAHIIEKMEVKNTIQLVGLAARYKLVDNEFVPLD